MHFFSKVFSAETSSSYALNTACFNVTVEPLDRENYYSSVDVAELGSLTLGLVQNSSSIVTRQGEEYSDPDSKRFTIMHVVEGEMVISHKFGTIPLKAGQFTLIDNSIPRKMFVYNKVKLLLVCCSHATLQQYVPNPASMLSQVLNETLNEAGRPIFCPLLFLWEHLKQGRLQEFSTCIGDEFLKDLSKAYARLNASRVRSKHTQRLFIRIKNYIEKNLHDPQLNAEAIAAEFNISTRYLRSLFQGGEKLTHYIQRRRIENSAELLISPQYQGTSITDIAYLCGFSSSTNFCRTFRSIFNETARDFRHRHLNMTITAKNMTKQ